MVRTAGSGKAWWECVQKRRITYNIREEEERKGPEPSLQENAQWHPIRSTFLNPTVSFNMQATEVLTDAEAGRRN